ncbi:MAG: N-acetyltransferase [Pseudomonadota bacterium]|nr:N-acetyltransferase [Pseudomonadota bacterium]
MKLSSYKESDKYEIKQLFEDVFAESEGPEEGRLISGLVLDLLNTTKSQDIFGFVAREGEKITCGLFFTRLHFDGPIEAFILSPVAVKTECQGKGIGKKLINYGLEQLRDKGVKLVFTYGDPAFYSKVGFKQITEEVVQAPLPLSQPEGWLCQSLDGDEIKPVSGRPRCVEALNKPEYW